MSSSSRPPVPTYCLLPTQGRREREHLYDWIMEEEEYVAVKFDDQRDGHDESLSNYDIEEFWFRQIVQYLDRAKAFLAGLKDAGDDGDVDSFRQLELLAQQAMVKCMMTAKGMVESSIRVYGPLPKPGVSSGNVEPWDKWKDIEV